MDMDLVGMINSSGIVTLRNNPVSTAVLGLSQSLAKTKFRVDKGETRTHKIMVFTEYVGGKIEYQNLLVRPKKKSLGAGAVYSYRSQEGVGTLTVADYDQEVMPPDVAISRLRAYGVNKF